MFFADDNNSLTVPFSDHQFLLYSKLLDDADNNNPNPYSPFSCFFDQSIFSHPIFMSSDYEQHQLELQNSILGQDHEEQPILRAFEECPMADTRSKGTSCYVTTENFHHNGFASDPSNGISSSAVGNMNHDNVRKNGNSSKKDRHSKINTSQGPRDRRMRLSLDVARRFFGLQDMLGFDKASKTVDWLLSKCQSEINKVAHSKNYNRNTVTTKSDSFGAACVQCCEEVSEVVNKEDHVFHSGATDHSDKVNKKSSSMKKKSGKASVSLHSGFSILAKESREKARARARERTNEKMMMICSNSQNQGTYTYNVHHYSNMDQNLLTTYQDESLANTLYWNSSSTIFSNMQRESNETSQQFQFGGSQVNARPWETYNKN